MSLSYKTSLLACQRMVDSKHFSTSTVTREIRQRKVVAKANGVPKLLLVHRQVLLLLLLLFYFFLLGLTTNLALWIINRLFLS